MLDPSLEDACRVYWEKELVPITVSLDGTESHEVVTVRILVLGDTYSPM